MTPEKQLAEALKLLREVRVLIDQTPEGELAEIPKDVERKLRKFLEREGSSHDQ